MGRRGRGGNRLRATPPRPRPSLPGSYVSVGRTFQVLKKLVSFCLPRYLTFAQPREGWRPFRGLSVVAIILVFPEERPFLRRISFWLSAKSRVPEHIQLRYFVGTHDNRIIFADSRWPLLWSLLHIVNTCRALKLQSAFQLQYLA